MADLPASLFYFLWMVGVSLLNAGVGVALLLPRTAWMVLLEDPTQVSYCRDITSEAQGKSWRRISPITYMHTYRYGYPLKPLNNLPLASAAHIPPLPTPVPWFSWFACGILKDKSASPELRLRMSEVVEVFKEHVFNCHISLLTARDLSILWVNWQLWVKTCIEIVSFSDYCFCVNPLCGSILQGGLAYFAPVCDLIPGLRFRPWQV